MWFCLVTHFAREMQNENYCLQVRIFAIYKRSAMYGKPNSTKISYSAPTVLPHLTSQNRSTSSAGLSIRPSRNLIETFSIPSLSANLFQLSSPENKKENTLSLRSKISNTRRRVSSGYQNTEKWLKIRGNQVFFFNRLPGVWIASQTDH